MRFSGGIAIAIALLVATSSAAVSVRTDGASVGGGHEMRSALVTDQTPVPIGRPTVPLPGVSLVQLSFSLRFSNESRLASLLAELNDPRSGEYHHFLTLGQFRSEFAPSPPEIAQVESAMRSAGGVGVTSTPGRLGVVGLLPASGVETLLGVQLVSFPSGPGATVYTAVGTPRLSAELSGVVVGVGGLSDAGNAALALAFAEGSPRPVGQFVRENGTAIQWAVGSDYARAYGASALWTGTNVTHATYPTKIAIATLLAGSYNESRGVSLPPFDPRVVRAYFNATLGPSWPHPNVTGVPVNAPAAGLPPLPGSLGALSDSTQDEYENSLDLEMAGSLAPGASLYNFYFNGSLMASTSITVGALADDFALDLGAALNHTYAPQRLAVVSASFGLPDQNDSLWYSELREAALIGVTIVCSSGDQGDAPNALTGRGSADPTWPATAAFSNWGAVSVGGTTVTLAGSPTSNDTPPHIFPAFDPNVTGIDRAVAWYEHSTPGEYAGSEGGVSTTFPEPRWQFDSAAQYPIVNATIRQGFGSIGRAGPDVAFPANNTIAFVFANATGTIFLQVLGGTSVAAPMLGGMLASLVAVRSAESGAFSPLGFIDPEIYRIASFYASPAVRNSSEEATDPFEDVVSGSNYEFQAAPGWDAVTGWGGFAALPFLAAVNNSTVDNYVYTGPTPTLPSHGTPPFWTAQTEYYLLGLGVLVAIALVILAARPSRGPSIRAPPGRTVSPEDPFAPAPLAAGPPGATFLCPYCGGERPSEPVRCPHCGML
jgi:subtilase family serine protease